MPPTRTRGLKLSGLNVPFRPGTPGETTGFLFYPEASIHFMHGGCSRVGAVTLLLVLTFGLVAVANVAAAPTPPRPAATAHAPILIQGNAGFTAANGNRAPLVPSPRLGGSTSSLNGQPGIAEVLVDLS